MVKLNQPDKVLYERNLKACRLTDIEPNMITKVIYSELK